jgi:hypothetical protein
MIRAAKLSPDGRYRYMLGRTWNIDRARVLFVMLNPSTADAERDDPTIRRCVGFARSWGYGGLTVGNLYAYRSTQPARLAEVEDPVGPDNDAALRMLAGDAALIVCAWGADRHAGRDRIRRVETLLRTHRPLHGLGCAKRGAPRHPLFIHRDQQPEPYR